MFANAIDECLRQQNLTAMRRAHDPRCAVDGHTEAIVVAAFDHPNMEAATDVERDSISAHGVTERLLHFYRGCDRVRRVTKRGTEAIAR